MGFFLGASLFTCICPVLVMQLGVQGLSTFHPNSALSLCCPCNFLFGFYLKTNRLCFCFGQPELLDMYTVNLHRIEKDVQRCDRNYWYFTPANLEKLRNIMCRWELRGSGWGPASPPCDGSRLLTLVAGFPEFTSRLQPQTLFWLLSFASLISFPKSPHHPRTGATGPRTSRLPDQGVQPSCLVLLCPVTAVCLGCWPTQRAPWGCPGMLPRGLNSAQPTCSLEYVWKMF